ESKLPSQFNHDFSRIPATGNGSKTGTPKTLWIKPAQRDIPLDPSLFVQQSKMGNAGNIGKQRGNEKKETKVETSIQADIPGRTVTTNVDVIFPWKFGQPRPPFEPTFFWVKEFKAGAARGPTTTPTGAIQDNLALTLSLKGLWYELENLKAGLPGVEDLGLGATVGVSSDLVKGFGRPDLSAKVGAEGSYHFGKSPVYLQAEISYGITIPYGGKPQLTPTTTFGFKIVIP
ncbi:MAG TPA: hypothetical protein VGJ82_20235, partial [Thermoanaerobaculia bacterium]